ncbi:MAG TPA: oligosaccharide flippase family protein [Gemmatimonadales bacterium]|nr:oligosaccharide flippase family protein [Gemmatimonadales bacterium]
MSAADALSTAAPAAPSGGLLRRVAGYSAMRGSAEALVGLRGILLATLLGPAAFGSWALLRLATRYAALAGLGMFRGLEVELLQAPDDGATRSRASGAALGFMLAVSGALAAVALLAAALVESPAHRLILQGFAAAVVTEAAYGYALVATRVSGTLGRYAMLEAGTAALHLLLGVVLARAFGLAGAFAGLALASGAGTAVAARWVEMRPRFDPTAVRGLLATGLPVALTGVVGTLLQTADRWVVAAWGGHEQLGYYAFGAALASAGAALALSVRTVVFPEVYGDARLAGAAAALGRHLERSLLPFATLVPPVLGVIGAGIGPTVALVAPPYRAAIEPARLFLLAGAAMGLVNLATIGAVAARRHAMLPAYAAGALGVNLGLATLAMAAGLGLEGAAAASLAGYLVFAAAVIRLNARLSGIVRPERLVVRALRPLVWCALAVTVAGHVAVGLGQDGVALVVYLLLVVPLLPRCRGEWRRLRGER